MSERLRIVTTGFLGLTPGGGVAWDYVQYVSGLIELGHDVWYVEDTGLWPIYHAHAGKDVLVDPPLRQLASVFDGLGHPGRWAYHDAMSGLWFGPAATAVPRLLRTADLLVNVSCATPLDDSYLRIPIRVLIDSDPMFTQLQISMNTHFTPGNSSLAGLVAAHTHHFTFGESVGSCGCRVPLCGVDWLPTRQPVVLASWPVTRVPTESTLGYTTVMNWSAAPPLDFEGEYWGQKDVELAKLSELPATVSPVPLRLVIGQTVGVPFSSPALSEAGWGVLDPADHVADWDSYRGFIQASRGELSIAKETYVKARTGWFSGRSACYLASGRPVIAQDTGWTEHLPSGCGLLAFGDVDEATEAVREVEASPQKHGDVAREIAAEFFDSGVVLTRLLQDVEG